MLITPATCQDTKQTSLLALLGHTRRHKSAINDKLFRPLGWFGLLMSHSEIAGDKQISQQLFPLSRPELAEARLAKPRPLMNPSPVDVVGSTETAYQGLCALETAMGGAKS